MSAPGTIGRASALTMRRCGWDVELTGARSASLTYERAGVRWVALVHGNGRWTVQRVPVRLGVPAIAQGQESHPCLAAMDANEIMWALRDGRPIPEIWRRYLVGEVAP